MSSYFYCMTPFHHLRAAMSTCSWHHAVHPPPCHAPKEHKLSRTPHRVCKASLQPSQHGTLRVYASTVMQRLEILGRVLQS
jgi:hypothetical protein